jgi:hypothetical protein
VIRVSSKTRMSSPAPAKPIVDMSISAMETPL